MSGRLEREGAEPDAGERRRRLRRSEDAALRDAVQANTDNILRNARVLYTHQRLFEDLGVETMSVEQRSRLPLVLKSADERADARDRGDKRLMVLIAVMGVVTPIVTWALTTATVHHP